MNYRFELIASNDHKELQELLNDWVKTEKPRRIFDMAFVADGAEFTYCAMLLYVPEI